MRANTLSILLIAVFLNACAIHENCRLGEQKATLDTLYFGMSSSDGEVSSDQWRDFMDKVVTPRFPQGLTVLQASGQWLSEQGTIQHEKTQILQLLHPESDEHEQAVSDIIQQYKTDFKQESVLRVRQTNCASF